ncbi:hypothetical protein [Niveispirillum fermenti]|uniref:hypothetical protein n=1 Tax=Niveispirillum fermenti TaxID=1233113 RepID=UPI003A84FFF3
MNATELAYVVLGVTAGTAAACRALATHGGCFTIMDTDQDRGHRLTLALNTGSRGRAIFIPGNPENAGDRADALAETARCWPDQAAIILSPAGP